MMFTTKLARLAAPAAKAYLHLVPWGFGKRFLYNKILKPYVLWRNLTFTTRTRFNAKMNVCFPDLIQSYIYLFGQWEPEITQYISRQLKLGDIFIDIGANIGYHTLLAAKLVGEQGQVFAIEASPSIFARLTANLELNGLRNVRALNVAVCAQDCEVQIFLNGAQNIGASTIIADEATRRNAVAEALVKGARLPAILPREAIQSAKLIKIDVEGAEWLVVKGFQELLPDLSAHTQLIIEVNARSLREHGVSVVEFVDVFRNAGFTPYKIENSYSVEEYLSGGNFAAPSPLTDLNFDQTDIVFRR